MRDHIAAAGLEAELVVVTFSSSAAIEHYRLRTGIDVRLLIDPDRTTYRAYGLRSASLARVWGFRPALAYLRLFARGQWRRLRRPTEDTRQLGGDFVIDPDGDLAFVYRSTGPEDRPDPAALVAAAR